MAEGQPVILIVDDEEAIRNILSRKLEYDGYNCEVAADGEEALHKTSTKSFDLVLLDFSMPGLSGIEVLRRLIAEHPDICVVMITAMADTKMHIESLRLGAYDYVTKPFDLNDVSTRIKNALEIKRLTLKKACRESTTGEDETLGPLITGQISLDELEDIYHPDEDQSTSGSEFAIPIFGAVANLQELAKYKQIAHKLLSAEIFRASIRDDGKWASVLNSETVGQCGGYNDLAGLMNVLYMVGTSVDGDKIQIPDQSLIKSIPWSEVKDSRIGRTPAFADLTVLRLERSRNVRLIAAALNRRQIASGSSRPLNNEAIRALMNMNLSGAKWFFFATDSLQQILQQQITLSQNSAPVGT